MNKLVLPILLFNLLYLRVCAQTPFKTCDSIDINNIHAPILVHGDMWWDPEQYSALHSHGYEGTCNLYGIPYYNFNFASSVWMSGYDAGNNLHVAAQTYRQNGNDYWPGPLDATGNLNYPTSQKWANIWKVNGTDVQVFNSLPSHTISNTPSSILTWPGKGNVNAKGNGGVSLSVTEEMAPFVDLNGNGLYEPLLGDYPDFPGEQALWWIFSDNGPTHAETNGNPLGVEVHAMAYAYKRGTAIDNVAYFDFTIVNKSSNNYHDFRLALWDDVDLGWYMDDFIGFDTARRLGICYNSANDDGGGGGHPVNFDRRTPVTGVTMVSLPNDTYGSYMPAGSFDYYNNDFSVIGNPLVDTEYNNYMRGKLRNGDHFRNDFAGSGLPTSGYGSGPVTNYLFWGEPGDTTQWSECGSNNGPGDRRFILSSNDFTLNAGSSQHIVMAMIVTDTSGATGCPFINFTNINALSDTAWNNYYNPPTSLHKHSLNTGTINELHTYPNPARNKLYIDGDDNATITIYNSMGQSLNVPVVKNGQKYEMDISSLPRGLYNVHYGNGSTRGNTKFVKE